MVLGNESLELERSDRRARHMLGLMDGRSWGGKRGMYYVSTVISDIFQRMNLIMLVLLEKNREIIHGIFKYVYIFFTRDGLA